MPLHVLSALTAIAVIEAHHGGADEPRCHDLRGHVSRCSQATPTPVFSDIHTPQSPLPQISKPPSLTTCFPCGRGSPVGDTERERVARVRPPSALPRSLPVGSLPYPFHPPVVRWRGHGLHRCVRLISFGHGSFPFAAERRRSLSWSMAVKPQRGASRKRRPSLLGTSTSTGRRGSGPWPRAPGCRPAALSSRHTDHRQCTPYNRLTGPEIDNGLAK